MFLPLSAGERRETLWFELLNCLFLLVKWSQVKEIASCFCKFWFLSLLFSYSGASETKSLVANEVKQSAGVKSHFENLFYVSELDNDVKQFSWGFLQRYPSPVRGFLQSHPSPGDQ